MLTRSHPLARLAADYIAISTVCTTKLQTRPAQASIQISAHLLETRRRNRAFRRLRFFIHLLGLVLSWEPWEKQVTRGGVGWETLLRGSWTIVFCQQSAEREKRPTGVKGRRRCFRSVASSSAPLQMVAAASCSTATHEARLLSVSSSLFLFVWLGI